MIKKKEEGPYWPRLLKGDKKVAGIAMYSFEVLIVRGLTVVRGITRFQSCAL